MLTPEQAVRAAANRKIEEARIAALVHTTGSKFKAGRDVAETAKLIRKDLAEACKAAAGPLAGCACKVTTRRASMMVAIDVVIVSVPDRGAPIVNPRWIEAEDSGRRAAGPMPSILSKRGTAIVDAAKGIADAYNFNKSDSMTDYSNVGFYGDVRFDSALTATARAEVRRTIAMLA